MKIGIHNSRDSFSDKWIPYCETNGIAYKPVDCYRTDIIDQLADCDALMWHFNHKSPKASKFARQLLYAVQASGKAVFPDYNTAWHFDDKVGQKYLLEAIGAPLAPAYVFYTREEAVRWVKSACFPKVFKLRNGAGSDNVRKVNTQQEALKLVKRAFGKGFSQYSAWSNLRERYRKYALGKTALWNVIKGIVRLGYTTEYARVTGNEKGYIYFQDFIPNNDFDIRVIVIGDQAFAIKRMVRENDFRASGSGSIRYEKENFTEETIRLAFNISEKLKAQCMAYDFVYDRSEPLVVEISYGFALQGYDDCPGYWDRKLVWHPGKFNPHGWMVENLVKAMGGQI